MLVTLEGFLFTALVTVAVLIAALYADGGWDRDDD